jgi:hypothetical protein
MMDLSQTVEYSPKGPVKKDLVRAAGSNIVLVCLEEGQEIAPHPEPYAVVFVVLQGEGTITAGRVEHEVKPWHLISIGKDEHRGIRTRKRMILLGIREG